MTLARALPTVPFIKSRLFATSSIFSHENPLVSIMSTHEFVISAVFPDINRAFLDGQDPRLKSHVKVELFRTS